MTSGSEILTKGTWFQVSNDTDYILQNRGKDKIWVKASTTEPTDAEGAIELSSGDVIASTIMTGVIWATAINENVTIAYAV